MLKALIAHASTLFVLIDLSILYSRLQVIRIQFIIAYNAVPDGTSKRRLNLLFKVINDIIKLHSPR